MSETGGTVPAARPTMDGGAAADGAAASDSAADGGGVGGAAVGGVAARGNAAPGEAAAAGEAAAPGAGLVGVPDAFERLWTPHRLVYVAGQDRPSDDSEGSCPFCRVPSLADDEGLVVTRGEHAYVVLNLYPYNPGHVLVCPYRHVADYTELTDAETVAVAQLSRHAMRVLRQVSSPHGFNLWLNQGPVAGAGVAAHLHQHVVPRWGGDANFLPIVAQTKALPVLLGQTRQLLADAWEQVPGAPPC